MTAACACGCMADAARVHAIARALAVDDLDAALEAGLLDAGLACAACTPACRASTQQARDTRLAALAARARYQAREARLARRAAERQARARPAPPAADPARSSAPTPALPSAAADALARAKARAAQRHPR